MRLRFPSQEERQAAAAEKERLEALERERVEQEKRDAEERARKEEVHFAPSPRPFRPKRALSVSIRPSPHIAVAL